MRLLITLFSCFLFMHCAVDRTMVTITKNETIILEKFQNLDTINKVFITVKKEPGQELMLCVTLIDKDSKKPLANQQVSFYHTDTHGEYNPSISNNESTARLNGTAITNNSGEIYIKTILPGAYGSSEDTRHIHTTVHNAKPKAYDIFFKQYSGNIAYIMDSGNDQMFFTDLKKTKENILVCFVTIEAKNIHTSNQ
ncbi:dioxygenase family protein [Formosa maritima]|uniref:Intradiol ring-cleavage dioxygenases domain-containing protein n=1 Tax=Formosa maritima TaxID=2592046 RepID=A0A5D0GBU2_9FLAO|nr:hypothetical protein [Formosa maritima]TYA55287.1 hypothetical protein FVF61_07535 [Formosa maritima]